MVKKLIGGVLSAAALFCVVTPGIAAAAPADCVIESYGTEGAQARCTTSNWYRVVLYCRLVGPPSGANPAEKNVYGPWRQNDNPSGAQCGQFYKLYNAWPQVSA